MCRLTCDLVSPNWLLVMAGAPYKPLESTLSDEKFWRKNFQTPQCVITNQPISAQFSHAHLHVLVLCSEQALTTMAESMQGILSESSKSKSLF